jgi:glycosyltransferase involved in cell wall biosynthesis
MVQPRAHTKARVFDLALLPLLRRCAAVLVLTDDEQEQMRRQLGPSARIVRLGNGITAGTGSGGRPPVIRAGSADGGAGPERPVVVFLARLHPRKRAKAFAEAARLLADEGIAAEFRVHGPDEGSLTELLAYIDEHQLADTVSYGGPVAPDDVRPLLRTASVYVLPSVGEIFPISLLEAMAEGVPTVTTDDSGIAGLLRERGAAVITDGSPEELAAGIRSLLTDGDHWATVRAAALELIAGEFAADAVAARLAGIYAGREEQNASAAAA